MGLCGGEKSICSELKRDSEGGIRDSELFPEVLLLKRSRKMPQKLEHMEQGEKGLFFFFFFNGRNYGMCVC